MDIIEIVRNVGFPILISLILITKVDEKIERLSQAINDLIGEIKKKERKDDGK